MKKTRFQTTIIKKIILNVSKQIRNETKVIDIHIYVCKYNEETFNRELLNNLICI